MKTISPGPTLRSNRDKWGMGVRHALFPVLAFGAELAASFPTLFSTASGVFGLVAGPSSTLRSLNYRVRLFSSLGLVVAPPACKPGQDTPANFIRVLTTGSGSATAYDGAFARGHGSRLFSLKLPFISQSSGVVFNIAGAWKFFTEPAESRVLPDACAPFVRLSAFFAGRFQFYLPPPEPSAPC